VTVGGLWLSGFMEAVSAVATIEVEDLDESGLLDAAAEA
jgi:hypothetical protein